MNISSSIYDLVNSELKMLMTEKSWTFNQSAQLLSLMQFCKLLDLHEIEVNEESIQKELESCVNECVEFLDNGLACGALNDISKPKPVESKKSLKKLMASSVVATSPLISPVLSMISPLAPLFVGSIPLLQNDIGNNNIKNDINLSRFEVIGYAKTHNKWIDDGHLTSSSHILSNIDTDLMKTAEQIVESSRPKKTKSDTKHAVNAEGARPHTKYAKTLATYCTLLYLKRHCKCISTNLENVVYNDIEEHVINKYPKTDKVKLRDYYVKSSVKLAMKTDNDAITRVYKLKNHWDSRWMKIKCDLPGH